MKNYYEILGCTRKATTKELRLAFKKKALKLHPDVNPDNRQKAERLFKEANTAFQVLSDDKKRREYDLEFFTQGEDEVDSDTVYYADEHYDREEEEYSRKRNIEDDEVIWNSDDPSHVEDADRNDRVPSSGPGVKRETSSSASRSSNQPPRSGSPRSGRSGRNGSERVRNAASWAARQSPDDDGTTPRPTVQSVMEDLLRRPVPASAACNICHGSGRISQARNYVITTLPCPHCVRANSR